MTAPGRRLVASCAVAFALTALAACNPCNRDGCDAYQRPAQSTAAGPGIAGIIASLSDVVGNGCQECAFAKGRILIWATPSLIADQASAAALVKSQTATFTVESDGHYEKALDADTYLVCAQQGECAAIAVTTAGRTTVNVRMGNGPFSLAVFEPGSTVRRTSGIFMVEAR